MQHPENAARRMLRLGEGREVVIVCGFTDLRKGIDGLAGLLKAKYKLDPCAKALYLFCGRRADRFKGLWFDEARGFVLMYVRLETNGHFQWPRTTDEARAISADEYRRLLDGLKIEDRSTLGTMGKTVLI